MKKIAIPSLVTGSGKSREPEPSGLTVVTHGGESWLYLVSDNGWVARRSLKAGSRWQELDLAGGDLEGISRSGDRTILIGQEDGLIIEYQAKASQGAPFLEAAGSSWQLESIAAGNSGMEAFTFLPEGHHPNDWGTPQHPSGFCLAAVQARPGVIYVYDVPSGDDQRQNVKSINQISDCILPYKISDLFYSTNQKILYILFDDRNINGEPFSKLQGIRTSQSGFQLVGCKDMPYCGCEGVAEHEGDLYVALDQNDKQSTLNGLKENCVLKFSQFRF